jgi:hypothetical protein
MVNRTRADGSAEYARTVTIGGDAGAEKVVVLEPVAPLIPGSTWKRQVRGSSLMWDGATRILTFAPPPQAAQGGWRVVVSEVAPPSLVRVRGELPYGLSGFSVLPLAIDVWAFVAPSGEVLGRGIESGARGTSPGWYRPDAMTAFAQAMGIEVRDDRVVTWRDLNDRYAGLVPFSGQNAALARVGGMVTLVLGGLMIAGGVCLIALGIAAGAPAAALVALLTLVPLGATLAVLSRRVQAAVGHRDRLGA